ncbi:MAG TPA: aldehyde dehydrogenase family protein, partial [Polyangiaceae bacterium]|nr:aldehyde dehydrogenase family protein [Polyangiaceae bacterium]
ALELANGTAYGLVAGLHSLDERQQARFIERAAAGNLYLNRPITGAIVNRQPFGGHKASSVGPGAKAGGPNYVAQLAQLADAAPPGPARVVPASLVPRELGALDDWVRRELGENELERFRAVLSDYIESLRDDFRRDHPAPEVLGQDNVFRYLPCSALLLWVPESSRAFDLACASGAALASGNALQFSATHSGMARAEATHVRWVRELGEICRCPAPDESTEQLAARLADVERVRWLGSSPEEPAEIVLRAAARIGAHVSLRPVLAHGRYELLFNHREQAISIDYHRYGHLGWRSVGMDSSPALRQRR